MKFLSTIALVPLVCAIFAHPLESRHVWDLESQYLNLTFHAGPVSFEVYILSDKALYPISDFAPESMYTPPEVAVLYKANAGAQLQLLSTST